MIFGIISVILCTKIINWEVLPKIFLMIQFPWRFLEFSSYFFSVIAGINLYYFLKQKINYKEIFIILLISMVCTFMLKDNIRYKNEKIEMIKPGVLTEQNLHMTNAGAAKFEYLPKKAYDNLFYIIRREKGIVSKNENAIIVSEKKDGKKLDAKIFVNNIGKVTLELPYIYYLGYDIYINNELQDYSESENGFIQIDIDKQIERKYSKFKS